MRVLLETLRREAAWENTSGAVDAAEALGALPGEEPVRALLEVLREADARDLSEDAGDGADEVWRLRAAVQAGLIAAGERAVPLLLARLRAEEVMRSGRAATGGAATGGAATGGAATGGAATGDAATGGAATGGAATGGAATESAAIGAAAAAKAAATGGGATGGGVTGGVTGGGVMAGSDGGPSGVSVVALRVLARARVAEVLPLATRWALDDSEASEGARWAAIEALGLLGDRAASRTLREVLSRPGSINSGWTKRLAASALARLGDVDALEVLLDDADWFARLGVAEALVLLDPQTATQLRRRVAQDVDPRVRAAAQK